MMEMRFHSMDVMNAKFDVKNNVFFVNFGFVKLVSCQDGFLINIIINPQLSVEMEQLLII
ncbi:unnamed protein product [Paramecium primaurelia]|uniref:Uncharacterized protein n=1 Tax=Paramecium primaurelia TaxID=5886 RepID=A0A8S1JY26_PARPR|nr:unnamed protein product [Paramecium primaurelia]